MSIGESLLPEFDQEMATTRRLLERVAVSVEGGCPSPTIRNETPAVIQTNGTPPASIQIVGLSLGEGRVRVMSGVDPSVFGVATITVVPRSAAAPIPSEQGFREALMKPMTPKADSSSLRPSG